MAPFESYPWNVYVRYVISERLKRLQLNTEQRTPSVKEWYHLKDCLAGILGGLTSIAVSNYQLRLKAQDTDFKCRKISGAPHAVLSGDGKYVDIWLFELQFGQKVEILLEMEAENVRQDNTATSRKITNPDDFEEQATPVKAASGMSDEGQIPKNSSFTGDSCGRRSGASEDLEQISHDGLADDIPVFELDCTYQDPAASRLIARLSHPILLTAGFDPRALGGGQAQTADLAVARRRYELVASESITRALLLVSRQNWNQAERVLQETSNILETIITNTINVVSRQAGTRVGARREAQAHVLLDSLRGILADIDSLLEGMEESKENFDRDHRNFGAQQVSMTDIIAIQPANG